MPEPIPPQLYMIVPPIEGQQEGGIFDYTPEGQGQQITGPLPGNLSGYTLQGDRLVNSADARDFIDLDIFGNNYVRYWPTTGLTQVIRGIQTSTLNRGQSETRLYGIMDATVDYLNAAGEQGTVNISFSPIAKTGKRVAVYVDESGTRRFAEVDMWQHQYDAQGNDLGRTRLTTLADLQGESAAYVGWASPQEVSQRALFAQVMDLSRSKDEEKSKTWKEILEVAEAMPGAQGDTLSGMIMGWAKEQNVDFQAAAITYVGRP